MSLLAKADWWESPRFVVRERKGVTVAAPDMRWVAPGELADVLDAFYGFCHTSLALEEAP